MANTIHALINASRAGKKVAAVDFVKTNPEIPATLSKLITSIYPSTHDNAGNRTIEFVDQTTMRDASDRIGKSSKDAQLVMELFPEMELGAQILISSIISPKDMTNAEINYIVPTELKVGPIANILQPIIQEHFQKSYKIEPMLYRILYQCLFTTGSYPLVVIPENSVDDLINSNTGVSQEALKALASDDGTFNSLGILGPGQYSNKDNFSIESLYSSTVKPISRDEAKIKVKTNPNRTVTLEHISVTDNFNVLKLPQLVQKVRSQNTQSVIARQSAGMENIYQSNYLNDVQLSELFYKNRTRQLKNIVKVKTDSELERSTIGEPLVMKLPSESIIPVYTPGNEEKHIGYFVLLDSEGHPLSKTAQEVNDGDLRTMINSNTDMGSYLLNKSASSFKTNCSSVTFKQASKVYADIIEADLLARLRNGIVGPVVAIAKKEEVYQIMLARALQKQNTQLLYIPADLVTYFAIKYDEYGVGVSLLDRMRNLNSLRAMLLFSRTMAQVRNSIGRSKVVIKLDENDPNPQKTIETAMHEVARLRQLDFPMGINNATDLTEWMQKAGMEFGFEGHPGLPDVGIEFSEHSTNFTEPNSDLTEELRKAAIMSLGLSPEQVDSGFSPDFATSVNTNNLLLSKRVIMIQEIFVPQLTDHCRKEAIHNAYVVDQVKQAIKENIKKITDIEDADPLVVSYKDSNQELLVHLLTMECLSNFEVSLAQPDTAAIKNQQEAMDVYDQMLDKALDSYISTNILPPSLMGEAAGERVDEFRQITKAYFIRQWMLNNRVLPELGDLGATDEDGKPILNFGEIFKTHSNAMAMSFVDLLGKTVPVGVAADKDIEAITGGNDLGESTADSGSSSSDSGSSDDFGSDDFGGDSDPFASSEGSEGKGEGEGDNDGLPDLGF